MRIIYFLFLLINFSVSAQIEVRIDSIITIDSITQRKFTINYHLENLTNKEVSFFLNPNEFIPNSRASMSVKTTYKIYQDKEFIDIENLFEDKIMAAFQEQLKTARTDEEKRIIIESHLKELQLNHKLDLKDQNQSLMSSIITLKPKQKIAYSKNLIWDKKRYLKFDENEFYLDEKTPHYFELTINLMKEQFKDLLEPEEFQTIMNNPNFIKGWFISNKMEINFKE